MPAPNATVTIFRPRSVTVALLIVLTLGVQGGRKWAGEQGGDECETL
jgi:hypothetical protein